MFVKFVCPVICILCLMVASLVCAETVWKNTGRGLSGADFQSVATDPANADTAYISSSGAVYKTTDGGKNWKTFFSAGGTGNIIHTIAVDQTSLYVGTEKGLYRSRNRGRRWKRIFTSIGNDGRGVLFVTVDPADSDTLFIGTAYGLFYSRDGGAVWEKGRNLPSNSGIHYISIDSADPRTVYAAAEKGVYKSTDSGVLWSRIYATNVPEEGGAVLDGHENGGSGGVPEVRCVVADPEESGRVFAGTSRGLLISTDKGSTWKRAGTLGLMSRDIRHLAVDTDGRLYTATGRGVFAYSFSTSSWEEVFSGIGSREVSHIAFSAGEKVLWAAAEKGIFRTVEARAGAFDPEVNTEEVLRRFSDEPTIGEIRQAAIMYAEVHPSKISGWRKAAARKALLPDIKFNFDKNRDWQSSTYFYSNTSQKYKDDDITKGDDTGWSISLTWELGELIWNNDQTSIDARARYTVQLRDDLLNEVTRLYFERRRLQIALAVSPPANERERMEKEIRLQELTAGIDALTGSYLSRGLQKL